MLLFVLNKIENIVKEYTKAYIFTNNAELNVELRCYLDEEDKELLLDDIDNKLRDLVLFSHEYYDDNNLLKITFK